MKNDQGRARARRLLQKQLERASWGPLLTARQSRVHCALLVAFGYKLVYLAGNVFAVRIAAQGGHVWPELEQELLLEVVVAELNHALHRVVGVLVLDHEVQCAHIAAGL